MQGNAVVALQVQTFASVCKQQAGAGDSANTIIYSADFTMPNAVRSVHLGRYYAGLAKVKFRLQKF